MGLDGFCDSSSGAYPAFSEYAVVLASEPDNRGEYIDASDPIVDIRQTINAVSRGHGGMMGAAGFEPATARV